jgi:death-on-curing protein
MSTSWVWIEEELILAVHDRLLAVHGGSVGLRDRGLLDSALARPRNLAAYGTEDIFRLAAAYAAGIVRNHPFVDGNKRAGFMATLVFLGRNGQTLRAPEAEATHAVLSLAVGEMEEEHFAIWLSENCQPNTAVS